MGFWRDAFSKQEITFVLDEVRRCRDRNDEGRITFGSGEYHKWASILASAIGLDVRTHALRSQIVRDVLFSPDLPVDFTEKDFRSVTCRLRNKYQDQELTEFRIVFPIWNLPGFLRGTRKVGDVTLNFTPSHKSRVFRNITREREDQQADRQFKVHFTDERLDDLRRCSICIGRVRANSSADANERASEAMYEVLGLVNLAADGGKISRTSFRTDGKLPVSEVLVGPHTTVHFDNGKMAQDGFWIENWVGGPDQKNRTAEEWTAWEENVRQLDLGLGRSRWRAQCKSAAARYYKAFSNPNLEESFLEGWRLFENISGSRREKIGDQLVRVSNMFEDNAEYLILGKHLALRRNMLAHGHAIKADDEETLAFQMLFFIVPFMRQYVLNGLGFRSPEEFWEFLELPAHKDMRTTNRAELRRRLGLLDKAAKFRGETDG